MRTGARRLGTLRRYGELDTIMKNEKNVEGPIVSIRVWLSWFGKTLAVGAGATLVTGLFLTRATLTSPSEVLVAAVSYAWFGLLFGAVSQMGLFAFLWLQRLGLGLVRRPFVWHGFLLVLVAVVFVDVAYLRHAAFGTGESLLGYFGLPAGVLAWALAGAWWKVRLTHRQAFVPTLFYLFAGTLLEAVPVLRGDNPVQITLMLVPLLLCNTWQVLTLHRLTAPKEAKEAKRPASLGLDGMRPRRG